MVQCSLSSRRVLASPVVSSPRSRCALACKSAKAFGFSLVDFRCSPQLRPIRLQPFGYATVAFAAAAGSPSMSATYTIENCTGVASGREPRENIVYTLGYGLFNRSAGCCFAKRLLGFSTLVCVGLSEPCAQGALQRPQGAPLRLEEDLLDWCSTGAGTPGQANTCTYGLNADPGLVVSVNEVMADVAPENGGPENGNKEQWIELINHSPTPGDLGGYRLRGYFQGCATDTRVVTIPNGTFIGAFGYAVLAFGNASSELTSTGSVTVLAECAGIDWSDFTLESPRAVYIQNSVVRSVNIEASGRQRRN